MDDACVLDVAVNAMICPPVDPDQIMFWLGIYFLIFGIGFLGWIINIFKLIIRGDTDPRQSVRIIGIFIPFIGAIVGWL